MKKIKLALIPAILLSSNLYAQEVIIKTVDPAKSQHHEVQHHEVQHHENEKSKKVFKHDKKRHKHDKRYEHDKEYKILLNIQQKTINKNENENENENENNNIQQDIVLTEGIKTTVYSSKKHKEGVQISDKKLYLTKFKGNIIMEYMNYYSDYAFYAKKTFMIKNEPVVIKTENDQTVFTFNSKVLKKDKNKGHKDHKDHKGHKDHKDHKCNKKHKDQKH